MRPPLTEEGRIIMQKLKWTETCLVHVVFRVIYFKRDWLKRNFGQHRHLHYFVLFWHLDAPSPSVLRKFKFLASSIVLVFYVIVYYMRCCQCVSSQLDTYIAEVLAGGTFSVNVFEFWHARGPSGLARLAEYVICVPSSQVYVEHIYVFELKHHYLKVQGPSIPKGFGTYMRDTV